MWTDLNAVREGNLSFFLCRHSTGLLSWCSHKGKTGDVNTLDNELLGKKVPLKFLCCDCVKAIEIEKGVANIRFSALTHAHNPISRHVCSVWMCVAAFGRD